MKTITQKQYDRELDKRVKAKGGWDNFMVGAGLKVGLAEIVRGMKKEFIIKGGNRI